METIDLGNGYILQSWKQEDASDYVKLIQDESIKKCLRPDTPATKDAFLDILCGSDLVAKDHHLAVKKDECIIGGISYIEEHSGYFELGRFWIAPQYRGNHLGEHVTKGLIFFLWQKYPECDLYMQVVSTNQRMIDILKGFGVVEKTDKVEYRTNCDGNPFTLTYWELLHNYRILAAS